MKSAGMVREFLEVHLCRISPGKRLASIGARYILANKVKVKRMKK